jgi:hypothetical protein
MLSSWILGPFSTATAIVTGYPGIELKGCPGTFRGIPAAQEPPVVQPLGRVFARGADQGIRSVDDGPLRSHGVFCPASARFPSGIPLAL